MKIIFTLFFLSKLSLLCYAQEVENILFVGNSLTYYHEMPQTLQKMLDEQGIKIKIQQSTFAGVTLSDHLIRVKGANGFWIRAVDTEIAPTVRILLNQHWDAVVLQQGTLSLLVPESYKYNYVASLVKLDSIIKTKKAKTVLYEPFTGNDYPTQICYRGDFILAQMPVKDYTFNANISYCSDTFRNSVQEFDTLQKRCKQASEVIHCGIAQVGSAFEACKKQYPAIRLYEPDNEHPSIAGSYLIACVFYKYLTGKKVRDVKYRGNEKSGIIPDAMANKLRALADALIATD